ncbi:hypothetical protein K469DRAFT_570267 [Zopfia rhizophila CBS 207.26]|uniref:Uncharacterized protein n=1 Tax=Zopfia rhizophila CBS 207.26 TaxID=1314779 RepID=A0A6A6E839_9PEZI|nr:hypothetical protein K469DRAFT_570267 [Zopfia rhizophila CBS 207.26]
MDASISAQYGPKATPGPKADPKCNTDALSGIPNNVFNGASSNVYGKFCDTIGRASQKELTWNVDASGNQKANSRRRNDKRTPPPNPKGYGSFNFELKWRPGSGSCNSNCYDAYSRIAQSTCGAQGNMRTMMTAEASLDVGCGTYSYKITGPDVPKPNGPPPTTVSAQYCYPADVFGKHGDIQESFLNQYIGFACAGSANKNFKAGDKSNWNTTTNGVPYNFNIWWKDNCKTDADNLNAYQPLANNKGANCMDLMKGNFKNCNNDGIGGIISIGCLGYELKASMTPPGQASS